MKDFRSITERYTFVHTPPNHLDYVQFRYPPKVPSPAPLLGSVLNIIIGGSF